ncbi:MAG: hypothetical protein ACREJC_02925 [Tepidisphaeraceae bacterium]
MPLIIVAVLTFVFQGSVAELQVQQFRINCPYPLFQGNVTFGNPAFIAGGTVLNYTTAYSANVTDNGIRFKCGSDPITGNLQASTSSEQYGATFFGIPWGWIGFVSHTMTDFFDKVIAGITMLYLLINAPAEATGLAWFGYANAILIGFIALGIFMVIRGN